MIRRPPRSTLSSSSAASDVYKRQGKHNGAYYYTIGQRKGLAIGGYKDPLFVISTNTQTNEIFVGEGKNHPGLIKKALKVKYSDVNWVNDDYNFENLIGFSRYSSIKWGTCCKLWIKFCPLSLLMDLERPT